MHRTLMVNRMAGVGAVLVVLVLAPQAVAQQVSGLISGYGSANYRAVLADEETPNDFSASISPIVLFQAGENLLFESEMEFELEGDETEVALEYAQVDYLGFDRFQITAGKFLLPFGVFSERLHPSWINKMPDAPPIYGHAHGGVAEGALLPVLSDAGVMVRFAQPMGELWRFDLSAWVSQGPRLVDSEEGGEEDHSHTSLVPADDGEHEDGDDHGASTLGIPDVAFGTSFGDNNENKLLGARLGLVRGGGFEAYVSGFHSMIDPDDALDFTAFNISAEFRRGPFEIRGEGILTRQEFVQDEVSYEKVEKSGFYLQASHRLSDRVEPVFRYAKVFDPEVNGEAIAEGFDQIALGLNYWLMPSVPVKAAYEIDPDGDDRVLVQWAFGF